MVNSAIRFSVATATFFSFSAAAIAEPVSGVWSSQYGCSWLEQKSHDTDLNVEDSAVYALDYLDDTGVNGLNWGCSFNSLTSNTASTFTANSSCWMETEFWKQDITVTKDADKWIVIMYEDANEKVYLVFDTQCIASKVE